MKPVRIILFGFFIVTLSCAFGQDSEKKLYVGGYIKDMLTTNVLFEEDSAFTDNLIHHRLNIDYLPNDKWMFKIDFRNRIFFGDLVSTIPDYGSFIDVNNDYFNLSWMPVNNDNLVIHTMIDRAFFKYKSDSWSLTVGRQRVNWGLSTVWTPNDIFNSFNFFDFDYEERLGSDAIRFQKFNGYASGYELVVKAADSWDKFTGSFLYRFNYKNYDLQALAGVMKNNIALGGGWAGNLNLAGFKGEFTYFLPLEEDQDDGFLGTISYDYSFPNTFYLIFSGIYSSYGDTEFGRLLFQNTSSDLDVRSLSPFPWSIFSQASYQFNALIFGSGGVMYFPGNASVIFIPTITVSLFTNLDFDFVSQLSIMEDDNLMTGNNFGAFYFRLKYSY